MRSFDAGPSVVLEHSEKSYWARVGVLGEEAIEEAKVLLVLTHTLEHVILNEWSFQTAYRLTPRFWFKRAQPGVRVEPHVEVVNYNGVIWPFAFFMKESSSRSVVMAIQKDKSPLADIRINIIFAKPKIP